MAIWPSTTPPADFETRKPYLIVELDEACRLQQVGEGWFKGIGDVPTQAISMSVNQILASAKIVCSVPDRRKAEAVKNTLQAEIGPMFPASALRRHGECHLLLDRGSAALV